MKKNETVLNVPLLYIVQPRLEPTVSHMQMSYRENTQKGEVKLKATPGFDKEIERRTVRNEFKQFQEMELDEQLRFLANLPNRLAHLKCKLVTKNGEYEGILRGYDRDVVLFLDIANDKQLEISVQQIVSITLIGLREL